MKHRIILISLIFVTLVCILGNYFLVRGPEPAPSTNLEEALINRLDIPPEYRLSYGPERTNRLLDSVIVIYQNVTKPAETNYSFKQRIYDFKTVEAAQEEMRSLEWGDKIIYKPNELIHMKAGSISDEEQFYCQNTITFEEPRVYCSWFGRYGRYMNIVEAITSETSINQEMLIDLIRVADKRMANFLIDRAKSGD